MKSTVEVITTGAERPLSLTENDVKRESTYLSALRPSRQDTASGAH